MAVDPIAAVRSILLSDATIEPLVGDRVFGGAIPADENAAMPRACVLLSPAGGGLIGRGYQDYADTRIDTHCYGSTPHEAWMLHLAVRAVLTQLRRQVSNSVLIHWARISSDGALARDHAKEWPLCYASYQVLAATVAAD